MGRAEGGAVMGVIGTAWRRAVRRYRVTCQPCHGSGWNSNTRVPGKCGWCGGKGHVRRIGAGKGK